MTPEKCIPNKIELFRSELLTDYVLTVALVSTYGVVFAFVINLSNSYGVDLPSTFFGALLVCALISIVIYYGVKRSEFRECKQLFKE